MVLLLYFLGNCTSAKELRTFRSGMGRGETLLTLAKGSDREWSPIVSFRRRASHFSGVPGVAAPAPDGGTACEEAFDRASLRCKRRLPPQRQLARDPQLEVSRRYPCWCGACENRSPTYPG